ncbi:FtsX-like permease family protein [Microbispora sp. H13382]|uniref:FtsX-like permease family protein n=1 Tax=Microbispora sp. H13382 TaxID=2729112 RepID=UPI0016002230|nr:FtsX-like permease family protein [Microbispora sp. H13382]
MRGLRAALRISRRTAWRSKGRSALILAMLALPVAVATFALTALATMFAEQHGHYPLGRADALVQGAHGLEGISQDVWGGEIHGARRTDVTPYTRAEVAGLLPGSRLIPVSQQFVRYLAPGGYETGTIRQVDLRDPMSLGTFRLVEGRLPAAPGEAVISAPELDAQVRPGATLLAGEDRRPLRIVGVALFATTGMWPDVVAFPGSLPESAFELADPGQMTHSWLVDAPRPLSWADVRRLNARGLLVVSRAEVERASAAEPRYDLRFDSSTLPVLPWTGIALLQVVLAAGPAFAVGRRRRAREFALVAAQGGSPAQLRMIALADGLFFGVAGSVAGAAIGIAAVPLAMPGLELWTQRLAGPVTVLWTPVALIAVLGVVAGLLAALAPAIGAGRTDAVAVLSGRRERRRDRAGRPLLGAVLVAAGVAATAVSARYGVHWVAASALLTQLGLVALVPAFVAVVGRVAVRFPLPLRFAARDAVRNRGRTVPAVAAVMTTVVVLTAAGITSQTALAQRPMNDRDLPQGPTGALRVTGSDLTPELWDRVRAAVRRELPADVPLVEGRALATKAGLPLGVNLPTPLTRGDLPFRTLDGESGGLLAGDESLLRYVLGREDPRAVAALRAGKAVVLNPAAVHGDRIEVQLVSRDATALSGIVSLSLPAVGVPPTGQGWARAVVAPEVIEKEGYGTVTSVLAVNPADYRTPRATADRIAAAVEAVTSHAAVRLESRRGPADDLVVLLVLAVAAAVLVLGMTFVATALAAVEARPDLETMAAVGADPRVRRAVVAGQALVIALLGTTAGVLAGLPPGIAAALVPSRREAWMLVRPDGVPVLVRPGETPMLVVPWPLVGLLIVALPLLAALGGALFTGSRLPLPRRRVT